MRKYSICIVGGGSRYTPGILRMLTSQKDKLPLKRIVLYDNESERQDKIGKYGEILMKEYYPELESFEYTTDHTKAFDDIDFFFMQIRAGRLEMREQDEKISIKHGCVGQETCGPGGFAYGMRSVPAIVEIVKNIRKQSPDAWILNYSNPAAIVAEATKRIFPDDHKIVNICDMPIGIMHSYASFLGLSIYDIEPRYFGLNHFGWFTQILDRKTGEDYLPRLREEFKKPLDVSSLGEVSPENQSWVETFKFMRKMVADSSEYMPNTYLQYYLYPREMLAHQNPNYTRANEVMDGPEKAVHTMLDKVNALGKLKGTEFELKPVDFDQHAGYIVDLAYSIANNSNDIFLCMTENNGTVSNLDDATMVEVPCRVGSNGIEPLNVGIIGSYYKGLIENQYAYEKLTVDACLEGSYTKALQALTLNRIVNDIDTAKAVLDEFIVVNKGQWPELN